MKQPALRWMRQPTAFPSAQPIALDDVSGLDERLKTRLHSLDVFSLFGVQSAVWKDTGGGLKFDRDLCVCAPTGSGKTLAYALPLVQGLLSQQSTTRLRALIVVPTGDLAFQVARVLEPLCQAVGLNVGVSHDPSAKKKNAEQALASVVFDARRREPSARNPHQMDILVTPPGRLVAHLRETRTDFSLTSLQYLVVDEADRILRQSYQGWLPRVLAAAGIRAPRDAVGERGVGRDRVKKMLVSATLSRDPARLAGVRLHAPRVLIQSATVDLGERNKSRDSAPEAARYLLPSTLVEKIAVIDSDSKPLALCALIQKIGKDVPIIVFTASVQATHRLFLLLSSMDEVSRDTNPVEYSSFDSQFDRASALASFASGASRLLVASDAATRGLDVHRVGAVISYDAPSHMKTYVHRVGRTARAGRNGVAYTLCRPSEESTFLAMLSKVENRRNGDAPERFVLRDEDVVAFEPSLRSSLVAVKLHLEADSKSAQVEDEERAGSTRAARVAAALACQNFRRGETATARL